MIELGLSLGLDLDGRLVLVEFDEADAQPCGRLRLTSTHSDDAHQRLSMHVYESEETRSEVGIASIDLDLERAELLLRHLGGWVKARRRAAEESRDAEHRAESGETSG